MAPESTPAARPASSAASDASSRGTRITRWVLVAVGVALLAVGAVVLMVDVSVSSYPGLLLWLAGSLVLHDGILAVIVLLVSVVLRRSSRRIPFGVLLIVQGAVVVAAIASLMVVPEILKKGIGTPNPTVLPLDYGANLIGFYVVLTVLTALAVVVYLRVTAKRQRRLAATES